MEDSPSFPSSVVSLVSLSGPLGFGGGNELVYLVLRFSYSGLWILRGRVKRFMETLSPRVKFKGFREKASLPSLGAISGIRGRKGGVA